SDRRWGRQSQVPGVAGAEPLRRESDANRREATMSTLSVQAVGRWFGDRELLHDVSFRVAQGDRIGLVGPNGTGKTTLLRIAAGLDEPDSGAVAYARGTRIGFLRQELLGDATGTVEEHARGAAADRKS